MTVSTEVKAALLISIFYQGPWEYLESALRSIDPKTLALIREVPEGSLRDRLADWCERRDAAWRMRYVRAHREPSRTWRRQPMARA